MTISVNFRYKCMDYFFVNVKTSSIFKLGEVLFMVSPMSSFGFAVLHQVHSSNARLCQCRNCAAKICEGCALRHNQNIWNLLPLILHLFLVLCRRLSKLEMLKRRGKGPPKKGQGRRAAKRNK